MTIVNIATVRETIENTVAEFHGGLHGWSTGAEDFEIDELLEELDRIDQETNQDDELNLPEAEVENGQWVDSANFEVCVQNFFDSFAENGPENGPENGYLNEVIHNQDADRVYDKNFEVVEEAYQELLANGWEFETLSGAICDAVNWAVRNQFYFDCANLSESIVEALEALR